MSDKYSMIALGHIISKRRQNLGLSYTKMHKLSQIDIRAIKAL